MIHFFYEEVNKKLPYGAKKGIKSLILKLAEEEKKKIGTLNYIYTSDDFLLEINRKYLNHDYYTDIITFDTSNHSDTLSGDLYISMERIEENAQELNERYIDEYLRVAIHGALHLCGYGDKTPEEREAMKLLENKYLRMK